jgi:hypothetical protein
MKKFILTIIAALVVAVSAKAQTPTYAPATVSVPSTLTGATNLATPLLIDIRKQQNVALFATLTTPSVQTNSYLFAPSVDGSNYDTNKTFTFAVFSTAGGKYMTNYTANGAGYLVLYRIAPTDTTIANTNGLKYGVKISAP